MSLLCFSTPLHIPVPIVYKENIEKIKSKLNHRDSLIVTDGDVVYYYCFHNNFPFFVVTTSEYGHREAWNVLGEICGFDYTNPNKAFDSLQELETRCKKPSRISKMVQRAESYLYEN